jgi:protein gp37
MASDTTIEWTHRPGTRPRTWNPTRGCSRISPGCENCYAEGIAGRFSGPGLAFEGFATRGKNGGRWTRKLALLDDTLDAPLRWRDPSTVFVNSMSDLFHDALTNEEIAAVFGVMAECPKHTFIVLTKRAKRMREWFEWIARETSGEHAPDPSFLVRTMATNRGVELDQLASSPWPLPNVWCGVSVESQEYADERIPQLIETPAVVRFLSCEPLLGPVDLERYYLQTKLGTSGYPFPYMPREFRTTWLHMLDWCIVGGESGHGARPFDLAWARSIVEQCRGAGVPAFVKQLGAIAYDSERADGEFWSFERWVNKAQSHIGGTGAICIDAKGRRCERGADFRLARDEDAFPVKWHLPLDLASRKGGEITEFPAELRVREFPEVRS